MNKKMRRLAALLALTMCLNAVAFAVAEGDGDSAPAEDTMQQEQPKAEEPKQEAPKAEEPKVEESNPEAPKEDAKGEDAKEDAPKAEEPEEKAPEVSDDPADEEPQTPADPEEAEPQEPGESEAPEGNKPEAAPTPDASDNDDKETPAFSAKVRIKLVGRETVALGDRVTLRADVEEANADYTVEWQYFNEEADIEKGENPWVAFAKGEEYTLTVDEENLETVYRVVLNGTVISRAFTLKSVLEREEADAEATPGEAIPGDEETAAPDDEATEGEKTPDRSEGEAQEKTPVRSVSITADWGEGELFFGAEATLSAVLKGYDNVAYTLQWQTSKNGEEWADVAGATDESYVMTVTQENYLDFWRVIVTVAADEAQVDAE